MKRKSAQGKQVVPSFGASRTRLTLILTVKGQGISLFLTNIHALSLYLSYTHPLSFTVSLTYTHSHLLSMTYTHTLTLSLSISLSIIHGGKTLCKRKERMDMVKKFAVRDALREYKEHIKKK